MPERDRTRSLEIALDRYWDAILTGASPAPEEDLDSDLAATVQRVHALDAAPSLHPAFASTLWEDLMSGQTMSPALVAQPSFPFRVRPISVAGRKFAPALPQPMSRIAAAILLIVLLAGSAFAALYPLRLWDTARLPLFAPLGTSTPQEPAGELEFLWESNGDPDPFVNPYGVGIDRDGNVWVSDGAHGRFQIFAPDGTFLETWGESGAEEGQFDFHATHGNPSYHYGDVAFDADGNIYVADTGNFRVQKFAPDRSFLLAWGGEGREDGQLMAPGGVAVSADGIVYVSDEGRSDVQMFDSEGGFLGTIGEAGASEGQLSMPAGVAIDGDGNVLVADFGNHRIQRFSPSGDFLATWGSMGSDDGQLHNPNDMAVDGLGRVYVADLNNYRLQVFAPDGRFLAKIGGMGSQPGQFFTPNALAVDANGVVYVSDNYRVQAFRLVLPRGAALSS